MPWLRHGMTHTAFLNKPFLFYRVGVDRIVEYLKPMVIDGLNSILLFPTDMQKEVTRYFMIRSCFYIDMNNIYELLLILYHIEISDLSKKSLISVENFYFGE